MKNYQINRVSEACCQVDNHLGLDVKLFANKDVQTESEAFDELFDFLDVERAIRDIKTSQHSDFISSDAGVSKVALTPDFHKGSGIPVGSAVETHGFVIPKAIGNDICCGMRLLITDLPVEKLNPHWVEIQHKLRAIFFQGKRNIPMSPRQREAVLKNGLPGLHETINDNLDNGIYKYYHAKTQGDDLNRIYNHGSFPTERLFGFDKLIASSGNIDGRDPQIGSVGGSNHFVELQKVDEIICKPSAHALDISQGNLAIMIHSGSVALGHSVGGHFMERAREIFPKDIHDPKNDFYFLPMSGPFEKEGKFYIQSMYNAANFAFANRLFLGLMVIRSLSEVLKIDIDHRLIYDAPHNLVFDKGNNIYLHRKGVTPAEGTKTNSDWMGAPVLIPGSMGSASYVLTGLGNKDALEGACHGAGRIMSRGKASHVSDEIYDAETEKLRIVGPIDHNSPQMQMRKDIMKKYKERIKEEAPYAYKPITPIIRSIEQAGIARPVVKLMPLCTIKGY